MMRVAMLILAATGASALVLPGAAVGGKSRTMRRREALSAALPLLGLAAFAPAVRAEEAVDLGDWDVDEPPPVFTQCVAGDEECAARRRKRAKESWRSVNPLARTEQDKARYREVIKKRNSECRASCGNPAIRMVCDRDDEACLAERRRLAKEALFGK